MILLLAKINYLFLLFFVWLSIREKFIFSFPKSKNKFCRLGFFLFLVRCVAMAWKGKLLLRKCTFCEINNWRIQTALKRCYFSIAYIWIVAQYFLLSYPFLHIYIYLSIDFWGNYFQDSSKFTWKGENCFSSHFELFS